MKNRIKWLGTSLLVIATLALSGCSGNVGVGLNVGVPIGDHGYMSIGGNRWY
ncbi:hypothetical protein [Marinihelvus fidelis]|uniref:hypothetical protein n=1 Tax=Marinihelvus fidelis TaxID=2613842 RepID=UPI001CD2690E|nr:hypothetical protein [Marinihelvus fidelis]